VPAPEATAAAPAHAVAAGAAAAICKRLTRVAAGKTAGAGAAGAAGAAGPDEEDGEQRGNGQAADRHGESSLRSPPLRSAANRDASFQAGTSE
jgi:hypothetical protein